MADRIGETHFVRYINGHAWDKEETPMNEEEFDRRRCEGCPYSSMNGGRCPGPCSKYREWALEEPIRAEVTEAAQAEAKEGEQPE